MVDAEQDVVEAADSPKAGPDEVITFRECLYGNRDVFGDLLGRLAPKNDYIETRSGNKINRDTQLWRAQNIEVKGLSVVKRGCIFRGDLALVRDW